MSFTGKRREDSGIGSCLKEIKKLDRKVDQNGIGNDISREKARPIRTKSRSDIIKFPSACVNDDQI